MAIPSVRLEYSHIFDLDEKTQDLWSKRSTNSLVHVKEEFQQSLQTDPTEEFIQRLDDCWIMLRKRDTSCWM